MILTLVEHDGARADLASVEALTAARDLAASANAPLEALLLGAGASQAAMSLGEHGVAVAHVIEDGNFAAYSPARCRQQSGQPKKGG